MSGSYVHYCRLSAEMPRGGTAREAQEHELQGRLGEFAAQLGDRIPKGLTFSDADNGEFTDSPTPDSTAALEAALDMVVAEGDGSAVYVLGLGFLSQPELVCLGARLDDLVRVGGRVVGVVDDFDSARPGDREFLAGLARVAASDLVEQEQSKDREGGEAREERLGGGSGSCWKREAG